MNRMITHIACTIILCCIPCIAHAAVAPADQAEILRVTTSFLEALRVNDCEKMKKLTDPRSVCYRFLTNKDEARRFIYVDLHRQVLRLKDRSLPIVAASLRINRAGKWDLVKSLLTIDGTTSATTAVVEFDYLKGSLPVLVLLTKTNNSWLVADMPSYTTSVLRYRSLNDAIFDKKSKDKIGVDVSQYHAVYPKGYKPPQPLSLTVDDEKAALHTATQYLEALRTNDLRNLSALTDAVSQHGISIRSSHVAFRRQYLDYWRKMLQLDKRRAPVDADMLTAKIGFTGITVEVTKELYAKDKYPSGLTRPTAVVVQYHDLDAGAALIPLRKSGGRWVVIGISDWSFMVDRYKSLSAVPREDLKYLKLAKPHPNMVCPVDDSAAK